MVSSGQIDIGRDELDADDWDRVWQDYDRRRRTVATAQPKQPQPQVATRPATRVQAARAQRRNRLHGALLTLAACLALVALPFLPDSSHQPAPAEALASLVSLAPDEAELPPLTTAVSRLAAESAAAACWVMRLAPQATPWAQPCIEP